MSQAVVHEDASRQRKHLSLVLQAPERRREHKAVVVAPEVGAGEVFLGVVIVLEPETFVVDKLVPLHHDSLIF